MATVAVCTGFPKVWKTSTKLGCNKKPGPRGLMVCRYADAAANFGSKQSNVGFYEIPLELPGGLVAFVFVGLV